MSLKQLLRKDIEPRCTYCTRGTPLQNGMYVLCRRHGVMDANGHCRSFCYDPLRRIPPKPAAIRGHFSDADFSLEDVKNET